MNATKNTFMFVVVAITLLALAAFPSSAYATLLGVDITGQVHPIHSP